MSRLVLVANILRAFDRKKMSVAPHAQLKNIKNRMTLKVDPIVNLCSKSNFRVLTRIYSPYGIDQHENIAMLIGKMN